MDRKYKESKKVEKDAIIIRSAEFSGSQTDHQKCPSGKIPEFAFVGRSNVGKSSLINSITQRKTLAKTSSTPGKTQLINHFLINSRWYLVDLPGYGWARVSKSQKSTWEDMVRQYLQFRSTLICTFVLIDSRHDLQQADRTFLQWVGSQGIPFALVFTKIDKLSKSGLDKSLKRFQRTFLEDWEELPPTFLTSATKNQGRNEILEYINQLIP